MAQKIKPVLVEDSLPAEKGIPARKKLIRKTRHKMRRQEARLVESYSDISNNPSGGLHSLMVNDVVEPDFTMKNHITVGQTRKMKKKLKKLMRQIPENEEKVFKEMQKYKTGLYRSYEKKLFNPESLLQMRRDKRMKRMMLNAKKTKAEVLQKKLQSFA